MNQIDIQIETINTIDITPTPMTEIEQVEQIIEELKHKTQGRPKGNPNKPRPEGWQPKGKLGRPPKPEKYTEDGKYIKPQYKEYAQKYYLEHTREKIVCEHCNMTIVRGALTRHYNSARCQIAKNQIALTILKQIEI